MLDRIVRCDGNNYGYPVLFGRLNRYVSTGVGLDSCLLTVPEVNLSRRASLEQLFPVSHLQGQRLRKGFRPWRASGVPLKGVRDRVLVIDRMPVTLVMRIVGKGRTQAAIILDAWLQGHQKALWVSASADLLADARYTPTHR